mgnify:CR=1 FL=1
MGLTHILLNQNYLTIIKNFIKMKKTKNQNSSSFIQFLLLDIRIKLLQYYILTKNLNKKKKKNLPHVGHRNINH